VKTATYLMSILVTVAKVSQSCRYAYTETADPLLMLIIIIVLMIVMMNKCISLLP